jgi:prephenate dehydrogenase
MCLMRVGIVGYGFVGRALARFLGPIGSVAIYDKHLHAYSSDAYKEQVNRCDLVFVAVPTPPRPHSGECDLTAIEETFDWLAALT